MDAGAIVYLLVPTAYLLGSVPFGIVMARVFGGADPRTVGSGNIGATNVARSAGKAAGALTLLADILKGALPVYLALSLTRNPVPVSMVGLAAFLGHLYPVYLGFKGGKGVATACGVMFIISPASTLLSGVMFLIVVAIKRYVSLGSMAAAAMLPVFLSFLTYGRPYVPMGVAISALVIIKHKDNIKRLVAGTENRIGGKKG